jgi:hypothetical protein
VLQGYPLAQKVIHKPNELLTNDFLASKIPITSSEERIEEGFLSGDK